MLGRTMLHLNFFSKFNNGSDIHRFFNTKWILIMCTVGNLPETEPSLGILEKFK